MIKGHDSYHNTLSRLAAFAKVTYRSDGNKGKYNTYNSFESYYSAVRLKSLWKRFLLKSIGFPIDH